MPTLERSLTAQPCSSVSWKQNGYYAAQDFCVREFIKTESATAMQRAFRLRFNIQPPMRKNICRWNHQFEQIVCVKAKAPADHVYQRRVWDELKRVLSVAHASQTVERAENLEYHNQLSGVCWGAVYSSIESIFLNHPIYIYIYIVCVCVCVCVSLRRSRNWYVTNDTARCCELLKQEILNFYQLKNFTNTAEQYKHNFYGYNDEVIMTCHKYDANCNPNQVLFKSCCA